MKGYSIFSTRAISALIFLCFTLPVLSQDPAETDVEKAPTIEREFYQEAELADYWETYYQASKSGDTALSEQAFEEIREFRRKEGNPIMEPLGLLFLQKAVEASNLGDYHNARQDYLHAIQMNPYLWPAYVNLGEIKAKEGKGWKTLVSMYIKGISLAFSIENTYFLLKVADWFIGNLIWIFCLSFFFYAIIMSAKYVRSHLHVFLSEKNATVIKAILASLILFLPFILGIDYYLVAGFYLIMFFPFFSPIEKRNTLIISGTLLFLPLLIGLQATLQSLDTDPEFKFKNQQYYLGDPIRQVDEISKLIKKNPKDEYLFSLGVLKQKLGDYQGSMENYTKIRKQSEFWPSSQVNRGDIFYLGQKYQDALDCYNKAIEKNRELVEAHYSKSTVLAAMKKHMEAEKALQKAKSLNSNKVENWQALGLPVINVNMKRTDSIKTLLQSLKDAFPKVFVLKPPFILPWIFFAVILVFSLIHSGIRNPRLLPQSCEKCGKVYYPSESPNSDWCSQCVHIYLLKSDLPSEAKIKKHSDVKSHIARKNQIGFWTHIILPGTRTILNQSSLVGWVTLFFWVFLLRFSFSSLSSIPYGGMDMMSGVDYILFFTWGTTFLYWVIFGLRAAWQED